MKSLLSAVLLTASLGFAAEDFAVEPPLQLILKIAGKEVKLMAGEQKQIEGEFKNPEIRVEAGKVRRFHKEGISFDYPASYNWKAEKDDGSLTWTMAGPGTATVATLSPVPLEPQDIAAALIDVLGETTKVTDTSGTFLGREFQGKKVSATESGTLFMTHVFTFPVAGGSLVLQIQDSSPEAGDKGGDEFRAMLKLLSATLSIEI